MRQAIAALYTPRQARQMTLLHQWYREKVGDQLKQQAIPLPAAFGCWSRFRTLQKAAASVKCPLAVFGQQQCG